MIIGLDMGGTHVDGVIVEKGNVINIVKNPTDRENLFQSIMIDGFSTKGKNIRIRAQVKLSITNKMGSVKNG